MGINPLADPAPLRSAATGDSRPTRQNHCVEDLVAGSPGSYRTAIRPLLENVSLRSSSRLAAKSVARYEQPVMLPPGRARFESMPVPTRSPLKAMTIGTVVVARLAAHAQGPRAMMR